MKKLFRASYPDESRIMLIIANNLNEAIELANQKELETFSRWDTGFTFSSDSVFEINLAVESQIIEDSFDTIC